MIENDAQTSVFTMVRTGLLRGSHQLSKLFAVGFRSSGIADVQPVDGLAVRSDPATPQAASALMPVVGFVAQVA